MKVDFIKNIIDSKCDAKIIVLKGFSPALIKELGLSYKLLDDYVIQDDRIILDCINEQQLLMDILSDKSLDKSICTCESFIKLCTNIANLSILGKDISVLENNFMELYPNPTTVDIPDFDSEDFQDTESETSLYSVFYSFCICDKGIQYIQYIDNYSINNSCVKVLKLVDPINIKPKGIVYDTSNLKLVSSKNDTLNSLLLELYNNMSLKETNLVVEAEEFDNEKLRILVQASKLIGIDVQVSIISRNISIRPREELTDVLKRIWGYDSFRELNMYKDLAINKDVISVSQGSIIETVVQQCEKAFNGDSKNVSNVLLTSPTGAGKSLLFQLSAIYIAEKYGLLTIVVSPLVALMNDQVEGLVGYDAVATLNSNKTAADKEQILQGIKDGNINILYLSPELLLSYTIKTFIGDRKIGLFVVDEAHTVTTWGRDFRVDYWFLGDYLRKTRRFLNYSFPIFALTATAVWDPSGKNDMVFDTIRSLNMDPCIKFIGVVRRDNIRFEITQSHITTKYEEKRRALTIKRIREALDNHKKTIVYFPFRKTVDSVYLGDDTKDIKDKLSRFHAGMFPEDKVLSADDFRSGKRPIMCATKAFGMGIDVSDIEEVYHHAPTGCLSDYVQEIGRLARDPKIVGVAKIDFSVGDFRYIRMLHGLSAIKPYQLLQVLKKLMAIYRINGEKRNILISSSDFSYIFPQSNPDDVDQNLKSCLLLISNDLQNKLRFNALIVRPKSLFSKCYLELPKDQSKDFYRLFHNYLKRITNDLFVFDSDKYWTEKHSNISFPMFKSKLANGKIFTGFNVKLRNKVSLSLNDDINVVLKKAQEFFYYAHKFLDEMSRGHHRISFSDIKKSLPQSYDSLKRQQFLETFKLLYSTNQGLGGDVAAYCKVYTTRKNDHSEESFQLIQSGYDNVQNLYISTYNKYITEMELCRYCDSTDNLVKLCEFLNSFGLADFQRQGGDEPAIFVRINNPYYLNNLIRQNNYKNDILLNIYEKYHFSEKIFTYFFTTEMTDSQRWDFIEAYFLGENEETLLNFV